MTAPLSPSVAEMFQRALETVRSYPLDEPDSPSSPELPAGVSKIHAPGGGQVEGVPGDLWSTGEAMRSGRTTAWELACRCAEQIARHDKRMGAFEFVGEFEAEARVMDEEVRRGTWRGPLHGLPISVKDVIDVAGMPTTGSSRALRPRVAAEDAIAVARLRGAGALITGKTVCHEFALGVTTPQSRNPWAEERVPGGSSGGSAIAIVTGMSLASLGTDTRASIRVPAALTGLVGYKPTFGLVPVDRWLTLSWTMDHFGPMARSVRDAALLMDVLTEQTGRYTSVLPAGASGKIYGYADSFLIGTEEGVRQRFFEALALLEGAGAKVVRREAPTEDDLALANAAGMVMSRVEAAHYHHEAGTETERCTPEVRDQLREAERVGAVDYLRCLRLRRRLYGRVLSAFRGIDAMVMPTSKVVAPLRSEAEQYLLVLSENCIPWSFLGFPAASLFAGLSDGLPVGIQAVGLPGQDESLIACSYALERVLPALPDWRL